MWPVKYLTNIPGRSKHPALGQCNHSIHALVHDAVLCVGVDDEVRERLMLSCRQLALNSKHAVQPVTVPLR